MRDLIARFPTFGSCRKGEYRISGSDADRNQAALFHACSERANTTAAYRAFESYPFIGAGWEWSVFRDNDSAIKVPAGIFADTSDPRYLTNTLHNYSVIGKYVDAEFIAETRFSDSPPNIRQPLLQPLPKKILFGACDAGKWHSLFQQLVALLDAEDWLPDLDIRVSSDGFHIRSIMTDGSRSLKIMDFTAYCDVFRLYELRMRREVETRRQVLKQVIDRLR